MPSSPSTTNSTPTPAGSPDKVRNLEAEGGGYYPRGPEPSPPRGGQRDRLAARGRQADIPRRRRPPHLDYPQDIQYTHSIEAARATGIKILAVASSGLNESGECIFRQIAQQAMGQFIFLLYESGDGTRTTPHDVGQQYWVNQLDKLIVRLIAEEIQQLHGKPEESTDTCRVPDPDSNGEVIPNEAVVSPNPPMDGLGDSP